MSDPVAPQSRADKPLFRSVVLDVDSTLTAIEGIDRLAELRGREIAERVAAVTELAMRGETRLEDVYGARLDLVRPNRDEVSLLASEYLSRMVAGVDRVIGELLSAGVKVVLVTGGIREAVLPLAQRLGVGDFDTHAVSLRFSGAGEYAGFDASSPLTLSGGKATVVRSLDLPRPILAVGDGVTDLEIRVLDPPAADAFAACSMVVARPEVVAAADFVVERPADLLRIVGIPALRSE